jgi:hypothetical protein
VHHEIWLISTIAVGLVYSLIAATLPVDRAYRPSSLIFWLV